MTPHLPGDTAFIILYKWPLIFVHWYHHSTELVYKSFGYKNKVAAGGWFMTMNYGVHAIMYNYYTLKAAKVKPPQVVSHARHQPANPADVYGSYCRYPDLHLETGTGMPYNKGTPLLVLHLVYNLFPPLCPVLPPKLYNYQGQGQDQEPVKGWRKEGAPSSLLPRALRG